MSGGTRHDTPAAPRRGRLLGRTREMGAVESFLATGEDACLLFGGDPGIGKTTLLDAAAGAAAHTLVLRATGVPFETDMPFSGLNELLLPLRNTAGYSAPQSTSVLATALGWAGGSRPAWDDIAHAALALIRAAAGGRSTTIVIDDLQHMDSTSTEIVRFLACLQERTPIKVLATHRLGVDTSFVGSAIEPHVIMPLTEADAYALLANDFPSLSEPNRQRIVHDACGNPVMLQELAHAVARQPPFGATQSPLPPLTPRLNALYSDVIRRLPERSRQLLLLAALDDGGAVETVQRAVPDCDALATIDAAVTARLVVVDSDRRISFVNRVIRSVVLAASTAQERKAAHLALSTALIDHPDQQVWHLADAATEPDESIAARLELNARHRRQSGDMVGTTLALYRAAELSPRAEDQARRSAFAAYVDAQSRGELAAVAAHRSSAGDLELGSPAALQSAITTAFVAFDEDANIDFSYGVLVRAVTDTLYRGDRDGTTDHALIVEAMQNVLTICLYAARPELWNGFYAIMTRRGWTDASLLQLCTLAMADPARTGSSAAERLDLEIQALDHQRDPARLVRIAAAGQYLDRVRQCRTGLLHLYRRASDAGAVSAAMYSLILVCVDDVRTGRWDDAQSYIRLGLELCESNGYFLPSWPLRLAKAWLAALRGDDVTALQVSAEVMSWASHSGAAGPGKWVHHILGVCALGRGDWEEAYAQVSLVSPPGELESHAGHALWAALDMVESAVRAGHLDQAAAHAAALREANVALISPRLAMVQAASVAMVADQSQFKALFEKALVTPGGENWPIERARIELMYGERLRRRRAISEARVHLQAALELFDGLGAKQWIARAEAELDATGPVGRIRDERQTRVLTPQERRVAHLAAAGLTNRQIATQLAISHRTVGAHLEQIFTKLDLTSRVALRQVLGDPSSAPEVEPR